ncbi:MAG: conjugal transfer protein TraX [Clostridia bacterium]|nr:conjugal transfer protein TraX [Clostridia bacterium]
MSVLMLKIIACISMLFDHLRYAIPEINNYFFLKNIGRLSFPLFAFCIVEGYVHTKNLKKYMLRLFVFGLISQYPFMLFRTLVNEHFYINIMFTFILGILAIICYDKIENKIIGTMLSIIVVTLGVVLHVDYGWYGVATCFVLYIFREKRIAKTVAFSILIIAYYSISITTGLIEKDAIGIDNFMHAFYLNLTKMIFVILSICFMCLYNGEPGKRSRFSKYFFYVFYPLNCLAVYIISLIH